MSDELPPWWVERDMFAAHLASELGVEEISAPLLRSLDLLLNTVAAKTRAQHEHPTPLVHDSFSPAQRALTEDSTLPRPTLPTEPPGMSQDDPPTVRRRSLTARGGFKAPG